MSLHIRSGEMSNVDLVAVGTAIMIPGYSSDDASKIHGGEPACMV